jgi:GNAT superfamily N-acetyltransferase
MTELLADRAGRDVDVRPLHADDVVVAEKVAWDALAGAGRRYGFELGVRDAARIAFARARVRYLLSTDPAGCFVAEQQGEVVGIALALRRGSLWFLSLLAVREGLQGAGIGRRLLEPAVAYGADCAAGMICASPDPKALRRYGRAGFALHAGIEATGTPRRDRIPGGLGVREGDWDADRELAEEIIAATRGEPYGIDFDWCRARGMRLIVRDGAGRNDRAVALLHDRGIAMLAGTSDDAAVRALWVAIAESAVGADGVTDTVRIPYLHSRQQWALGVALEAGLSLGLSDALATRGTLLVPPSPYLPSGILG